MAPVACRWCRLAYVGHGLSQVDQTVAALPTGGLARKRKLPRPRPGDVIHVGRSGWSCGRLRLGIFGGILSSPQARHSQLSCSAAGSLVTALYSLQTCRD